MTESFVFAFRRPGWLRRALVGGALEVVPALAALPVILRLSDVADRPRHLPFLLAPVLLAALACRCVVLGYLRRIVRRAVAGEAGGLPAWDSFGEDLVAGAALWLVSVGLCLPAAVVSFVTWLVLLQLGGAVAAVLGTLAVAVPALVLTLALLPAAIVTAIVENDAAAAFNFPLVLSRLRRANGHYVLAFLVALAAEVLAQLGLLLCCVGVIPARFLAHCVTAHAFGTAFGSGTPPSVEAPAPVA